MVPGSTLGPVETLPSPQLSRLYMLTMSDDRKLLLSFAPSLAVRLLRHEATLLSTEAALIQFVAGTQTRSEDGSCDSDEEDDCGGDEEEDPHSTLLERVTPKLLKHSANNREMAYPYSIFEPTSGAPLSTLSIYLSKTERRSVDKQIGILARDLSRLISPSGTFGLVNRVLSEPCASKGVPGSKERMDSKTWSEAFNTLLEGILRDGEDMNVLLPYETIRSHYQRLSWHLDAIKTPRLVVLDVSSETNVMVDRIRPSSPQSRSGSASPRENDADAASTVKLTGLRSWAQGVFGDPKLAQCFVDGPSDAFLDGWSQGTSDDDSEDDEEDDEEEVDEEDDEAGAKTRMLLYRCYRAMVIIVTEYYRPQTDSSRRELEGRRRLTSVLAELEKINIDGGDALKRVRSLEVDTSSKRVKVEEIA